MYTLEDIFQRENYSDSKYREEAIEIIVNSNKPIADLEYQARQEGSPTSFINTAIPLIHALKDETLNREYISAAEEFLYIVDRFLSSYLISETEVCIPFYFDADNSLVNKYLWPNEFFKEPMYFVLPDMESFKDQLDEYLQPYQNDSARYEFLVDLRKKASNSISYLDNRIDDLKTYHPFLKKYSSTVKVAKAHAKDIHYLSEAYLTPIVPTPFKQINGLLKGKLPQWELSSNQLRILYHKLKGKFIDPSTSLDDFAKLFEGKDISTVQAKVKWTDVNPKNKIPTSSTILKLFRVLAYNDCIDRRYGTDGGVVQDIAHECFLVNGKPPKKNSMRTAWSKMDGSSKKYKELQDIIQSIKSSNTK